MVRRKGWLIVLLIVLAFWLARWYDEVRLRNYVIEPAEITEPLKTWYVGAVAVDVPESFEVEESGIEFRSGGKPETATLTFSERKQPASLPLDILLTPPAIYYTNMKKLGQQDISPMLGRPSHLAVYYYYRSPNSVRSPEEPGKHFLFIGAAVRQGEAVYEFTRTEVLEQPEAPDFTGEFVLERKLDFIHQIFTFLDIYHWTDRNEPTATNQLVTAFGYLDLSGGWPQAVVTTSLRLRHSDPQRETSFLQFATITLEAWHIQDRTTPYRAELESGPMYNGTSMWGDSLFMIQQEKRKSFDFGEQAATGAELRLSGFTPKDDKAYHSYLLGAFNIAFESLRLAGEKRPE